MAAFQSDAEAEVGQIWGNKQSASFKPTRTSAFLHQHLEDMLKNGEGTDVAFSVDGQVFRAHRCLLAARSPVFKAELFGPTITNECAIRRIQIDDMEPSVFEALLHFIYTDSLPDNHKDGEDAATTRRLLVAAHRYRVDMLKFICETKLTETVDVSSVATMLILAEQHGCPQLRRVCIAFLASPEMLGAVMKTVGFKRLVATCPSVMEQILEKVSCVWGGEDHTSISSWSETVPK
ncbi:BTB/POZ and MATH domain-containing protein 1-like [Brachypodium distachyon]|uniref:BTB/POZ and MATH domain-containing protein 1-like n=1 Tax=Brachypodium distachyon TaxID=15368 RepID=UPI000D0DC845|nr:BTB/POZ and MATH domain-containing protein 1-like [Brachypodium distachyon]|eukprot:XP_024312119.1 BTB/POZ and MATH domain-containing protein 1-like [Brachypodium distachyon]